MPANSGLDRRSLLRLISAGVAAGLIVPFRSLRVFAAQDDAADLGTLTVIAGGLDSRLPGEPENSDVIMIARIDADAKTMRAISIPRDLYLEIPGFGYDKITRAYDYRVESRQRRVQIWRGNDGGNHRLELRR